MILYCIQHPANIIRSIIHKIKYHENEKAIFLTEERKDSLHCLPVNGIEYIKMPDVWKIVSFSPDSKETKNNAVKTIDTFLKNEKINLNDFTGVYVIYDMYNPFALFFEVAQIEYMCIETMDNQFLFYSNADFFKDRPQRGHAYDCLIRDMHLQDGQGAFCIKDYLFSEHSTIPNKIQNIPVENFGYYDAILSLSEKSKKDLVEKCDLLKYSEMDAVMLFNSPQWTQLMIENYQIIVPKHYQTAFEYGKAVWFYKIILDYYFENIKFTLKLHPASPQSFSDAFFSFVKIPQHVPIELFCLIQKKFHVYCPIKSTSIDMFKKLGFEMTFYGSDIIPFFNHIHFIYSAMRLLSNVGSITKILIYGIDANQFDYFKSSVFGMNFKNVVIETLTAYNIQSAEYIIAIPDDNLRNLIKNVSEDCLVVIEGCYAVNNILFVQRMMYSLIDISSEQEVELQKGDWILASKNKKNLDIKNFTALKVLAHSKIKLLIYPCCEYVQNDNNDLKLSKEIESLKIRENILLQYEKYLQIYYEAAQTGYSIRDYFYESGLLVPVIKMAFFATDEFGVMVYRIFEHQGIKFVALLSDKDREITFNTHSNMTERLTFEAIDKADQNTFTNVFMATTYDTDIFNYVRKFCRGILAFDAVTGYMYTRSFLLNKISDVAKNNPGVKVGIFYTPYIGQIPGEHSEIEDYFAKHGSMKVSSVLDIKDEEFKNHAKDLCYRQYGFDDEYIENVCHASYPMVSYNGVYMLPDFSSKYVNVINHRRVTTDTPNNYTNTIYFFGDSMITGLNVGDAETIESNFQRIVNRSGLPYIVHNCANSYGLHYDWIFGLIDTMTFKPGDVLLFCSRVDWLTEQYIKQNNKKLLCGILGIYTTPIFQRPHNHGEVFTDDHHCNGQGYGLIAQKIYEDIERAGFFDTSKNTNEEPLKVLAGKSNQPKERFQGGEYNEDIKKYLAYIKQYKARIGSIVMNCNPFTLGHRFLIEHAAQRVDKLYVFVVEEDKSFFPFKDRFDLVKQGTKDIDNVVVVPSGQFILSALTFQQYFEKGENQDVTIDASNDLEIFAKIIAPFLHITVRFAGAEPLDNVTRQYNASMRNILPQYGIEFIEISRKEEGGQPISASRVRNLLHKKDFNEISKLVPESTLDYLLEKYND